MPQALRWLAPAAVIGTIATAAPSPAVAQPSSPQPAPNTLSVTGHGTERIPAQKAQVRLGVELQDETAQQVQQRVAERTAAVVEVLRQREVKRLQTQGVSLRPRYQETDSQRQLVGYRGSNTVSFRTDADETGAILDAAVQAGATRIEQVNLTATQDAIAEARQQALREAVRNARQQAQAVLDELGLSQQEVRRIQIQDADAPRPRPLAAAAARAETANAATPVVGGEQAVEAAVTLEIGY